MTILFVICYHLLVQQPLLPIVGSFSVEISTPSQRRQHEHAPIIEVPRMSVSEFSIYWRNLHHDWWGKNGNDERKYEPPPLMTPILVTGVLTSSQCAEICSQFVETAQSESSIFVELQRRRRTRTNKKELRSKGTRRSLMMNPRPGTSRSELLSYNVSLVQAIDTIMTQSHHNDAFWCFQEGLFEDYSAFQPIHQILQSMRQSLLQQVDFVTDDRIRDDNSPPNRWFTNWFDYFPKWAQSTDCVILSGTGSTSTLHRDPFEWTGTSVCVEGTKVWRFIEPTPNTSTIDAMMNSYRLPSVAWNGNTTISAGWQSDFSLYRNINASRDGQRSGEGSMEPTIDGRYRETLKMAQSLDCLQPDQTLIASNLTATTNIWTAVQQEGDFLIIPSNYWHQTYTIDEPTVTISSQHCSDFDIVRVLNHIVTTTNRTNVFDVEDLVAQLYSDDSPKERMQQFFQRLQETLL